MNEEITYTIAQFPERDAMTTYLADDVDNEPVKGAKDLPAETIFTADDYVAPKRKQEAAPEDKVTVPVLSEDKTLAPRATKKAPVLSATKKGI